jgi:hypothetical protein
MSALSDFRALVLSCVTDEWQTLQEIADKVLEARWQQTGETWTWLSPADYAYHRRVANALWQWYIGGRVDNDHPAMSVYNRDLKWRRTQEADHE